MLNVSINMLLYKALFKQRKHTRRLHISLFSEFLEIFSFVQLVRLVFTHFQFARNFIQRWPRRNVDSIAENFVLTCRQKTRMTYDDD